jgi:hypothetical protein
MYVPEKTRENVKDSLRSGSFYVSTGLVLKEFSFINNVIRVSGGLQKTYVKENKYVFIGKDGEILKEVTGEYGEYTVQGSEMYVRVQVISEHGAMLWTQPIYKEGLFTPA